MKIGVSKLVPKIKSLVREKVGPAARGAVQDKEKMEFVVSKIYVFLPSPIRYVFSENQFFEFCWEHKSLIFGDEKKDSAISSEEIFIENEDQIDNLSDDEMR